ncbi:diadenosine tetraphosphate hydrolase [Aeromonas veronii]|nr:diadenosine tetraphosphate hydrolase [Aeromonas veronii]
MDETAAPAAVFPSASPSARANWRRLDYLAYGNPRQRSAHALLTAGVWDALAAQCADMALVSTLAIGLDRPGSDLDILCQHPNPAAFAATQEAQGWQASAKGDNIWLLERVFPCAADSGCDNRIVSWPLELYVTPAPIETLNGWRHLTLMAALLERFGDAFYQEVLRLRLEDGLKGEAAICRLLGLAGDPYAALLTLEGCNLAELSWQPPSRDGMHASTDAAAMAPAAHYSSPVVSTTSATPVCPVSTESPTPTS